MPANSLKNLTLDKISDSLDHITTLHKLPLHITNQLYHTILNSKQWDINLVRLLDSFEISTDLAKINSHFLQNPKSASFLVKFYTRHSKLTLQKLVIENSEAVNFVNVPKSLFTFSKFSIGSITFSNVDFRSFDFVLFLREFVNHALSISFVDCQNVSYLLEELDDLDKFTITCQNSC